MKLVYHGTSRAGNDLRVYEGRSTRYLCVDGAVQTAFPMEKHEWLRRGGLLAAKNYLELLPYFHPAGKDALIFGVGAGYLPDFFKLYDWNISVVERDPAIAELATLYFNYHGPCLVDDAVAFHASGDNRYDFIVIDHAANDNLPGETFTREWLRSASLRLKPGGVLAVSQIGYPHDSVNLSLYRTLQECFRHVVLYEAAVDHTLRTVNLFACDSELKLADPDRLENRFDVVIPEPVYFDRALLPSEIIFTDGHNNIDALKQDVRRAWKSFSDKILRRREHAPHRPKTAFYSLLKRKSAPPA